MEIAMTKCQLRSVSWLLSKSMAHISLVQDAIHVKASDDSQKPNGRSVNAYEYRRTSNISRALVYLE